MNRLYQSSLIPLRTRCRVLESTLLARCRALEPRKATTSSQHQLVSRFSNNNTGSKINMQVALIHTKPKSRPLKDKHGRRIVRRVYRVAENTGTATKKIKKKTWPQLNKIPTPTNTVPKPIQPPPNLKPLIPMGRPAPKAKQKKARKKLRMWLKDNAGIILFNFGSLCSFLSFTRKDILELRVLSITGSVSAITYFMLRPPPIVVAPVIWATIFAGTNAYMVYLIYEERKGKTQPMTAEEESAYEEHFLPHAVTPRQYEKLLKISKRLELSRGDVLIQKGDKINKVYLVVSGATEAVNTLSRRVSAASSSKGNKERFAGGDAGAWIGDIAYFDYLSELDRQSGRFNKKSSQTPVKEVIESLPTPLATAAMEASDTGSDDVSNMNVSVTQNAILTYIATQDNSIVYEWDFKELADLMETSADLRSSISRAMTAAVVGKVVNLYISTRSSSEPFWKRWLGRDTKQSSVSLSTSTLRVNITE